jgi:hypothetical protein
MPRLSTLAVAIATLAVALVTAAASAAAPAATAAAPPPPITPEARAAGMKAAPALIAAANLPCSLSAARVIGNGKDAKGQTISLTEIACKDSLGFVVATDAKGQPGQVFDCLMAATTPNLGCRLPENANPAAGLQSVVNQTGRACTVDKAHFMGMTTDKHIYEVACSNGEGVVLLIPIAGGAATSDNCLAYAGQGNIQCTLTTTDQEMAEAKSLETAAAKCTVAKDRYMLSTEDGSDYFEIACPDGKGYVLHGDKTGALAETIPCAEAFSIGSGCTLTDARQAETQEATLYSGLAKGAGFDCQVSKYALFPQSDSTKDIVEMVCSNRADGAVGIFPAKGAGLVYDCIRSQDEGYKCTFTPDSAVYPHLSDALRAAGKGSCVVSSARPFAHGVDGSDYVEVGCADGGSGWVLIYPAGSPSPKELLNCAQAHDMNGGCQLSGNKKT